MRSPPDDGPYTTFDNNSRITSDCSILNIESWRVLPVGLPLLLL